jgi:hypothetical protein
MYAVTSQKDLEMLLAIPLDTARAPGVRSEAAVEDCARASTGDPLEELLEMRYREYLARRALQELFEAGLMHALEV